MTGCWIFHPEELMQKSPNVRLAMTRLSVAYVQNHDAKPIIVVRSERRLSSEGEPVTALEPNSADDRSERAAQTVSAELLATRIDSQQTPRISVSSALARERGDLALHGRRHDDVAGLRQLCCLVVWAEAIRNGRRHELATLQRVKAVAIQLVELTYVGGIPLL